MRNNNISARFAAISLIEVDNAEITNNQVHILARLGRGIYVGRDSDRNQILDNRITTKPNTDTLQTFRAPGPELDSNPVLREQGVAAVVIGSGEPPLLTAVISGRVRQFTSTDYADNNVVKRNIITVSGEPADGIAIFAAQATQVAFNTIVGAKSAIRLGLQRGRQAPGRCAYNKSRSCLGDRDCRIAGPDKGTCSLPSTQVSWVSRYNTISDNSIKDFGSAIGVAGRNTTIRCNTIEGTLLTGLGAEFPSGGIVLNGKHALETTLVTRNTLTVSKIPFRFVTSFEGLSASVFGAQIWLNDVTGYTTAVLTDNNYNLVSKLSVSTQGNYWGTSSQVGLRPSAVLTEGGMQNQKVRDNHAFGASVARPCP
jgi:hypothetical protein